MKKEFLLLVSMAVIAVFSLACDRRDDQERRELRQEIAILNERLATQQADTPRFASPEPQDTPAPRLLRAIDQDISVRSATGFTTTAESITFLLAAGNRVELEVAKPARLRYVYAWIEDPNGFTILRNWHLEGGAAGAAQKLVSLPWKAAFFAAAPGQYALKVSAGWIDFGDKADTTHAIVQIYER